MSNFEVGITIFVIYFVPTSFLFGLVGLVHLKRIADALEKANEGRTKP